MDGKMTDAQRLRAYQIMTEPEPWEGLDEAEVAADLEPLRPEFVERLARKLVRGVQEEGGMSDRLLPVSAAKATSLVCPWAMGRPVMNIKACLADKCMAWVWTGPEFQYAADPPVDETGKPEAGWELTPDDEPFENPVAPRCKWRKPTGVERRGRCALIPAEVP